MTGFEAKAPRFPKPKIADQLLITATNFLQLPNRKQVQGFSKFL